MSSEIDILATIVPKSNQLTAIELMAGPIVITVTKVVAGESPKQPIAMHFEGDCGRPYYPCKTMRQTIVYAWGSSVSNYVGKKIELYRDGTVTYGSELVGGIRISSFSDIEKPFSLVLTLTRGKTKSHTFNVIEKTKRVSSTQIEERMQAMVQALKEKIKLALTREEVEEILSQGDTPKQVEYIKANFKTHYASLNEFINQHLESV